MAQYKDHPIYGLGFHGAGAAWLCRGLVFNARDKVTEIKKLERAELSFDSEAKAKAHALQLCKAWIDEQGGIIAATGIPALVPQ